MRRQIILVSILLSSAIAILLAIQTSRTITRPLQAVTEVAQKVTLESNFNLQAPVLTEDEVGVLAISLNQLMAKVRERTQELEEARETLEHKVKERTQELTEALAELKQAQAQLIQSEKMSSLGQMVAGIAHEINNPVNFIYGNIQPANQYVEDLIYILKIYEQEYPNPTPKLEEQIEAVDLDFVLDDLPKLFSSMKMGAERIRQIVLSLRNFSRLDESEMKRVDIHEGIESTLVILNNRLKKGIEVKKNYGNIPWVECYPAQINQVFMNLLNNAIDALEDTKRQKNFLPCLEIMTQQINHQEISIQIRDNGTGIPDDIKAKLFDPFFTTKDVGKGTGLGLSISYKIVEKHSGKIKVESELGKGTEFAIALPISQQ
ncbi:MAG: sensor histidine kinase [Halothece sp.]